MADADSLINRSQRGAQCEPLILVPTAMERERLELAIERIAADDQRPLRSPPLVLCGFGIAAAAAMTMRHLQQYRTAHVILAGIAGSLSPYCEIGSAYWFSEVFCDGIGVGEGESFVAAAEMGWNQIGSDPPIGDAIDLHIDFDHLPTPPLGLVSGCAASADRVMALRRCRRIGSAVDSLNAPHRSAVAAEDMEGFGVAIACRLMNVRLSIVRGISNQAGDRVHTHWRIGEAIDAVAEQLFMAGFVET